MILNCAESVFWKRTLTFLVHSSLSFGYCLMVVLGGVLVANKSYAQTCHTTNVFPGVRVVVQNLGENEATGKPVSLYVRNDPTNKGDNHLIVDGEKLKVFDAYEGTVIRDKNGQYSEKSDGYVWYYVRWDRFPRAGWSAGILDDHELLKTIKWIVTIDEAYQKNAIVEALFNGENRNKTSRNYIHHYQTIHDYNDYGCNANWGRAHSYPSTGHSGWDVAAHAGDGTFYSLTAGELLRKPVDGKTDSNNTIAIYDRYSKMTILYLHARVVSVTVGRNNMVKVGQPLGIQGATGNATGVHVHIEIQKGKSETPASRKARGDKTINPIPCLYRWAIGARVEGFLPWDVNHDGQVDRRDYTDVFWTAFWGRYRAQHDVNCDGEVNWDDVDIVGAKRTAWLAPVANAEATPPADQTLLLPNYPNPFNPETWIPYSLAEAADVKLTIYDTQGTEVRRFDLGHQPAGHYADRRKSIYWDGRNMLGEKVGGGVYFYYLQAGSYSATRRMVILK